MRIRFGFDVEIHRDRDEPEQPDAAEPPMVDQKGSHILDRRPEYDLGSAPVGFCAAPSKGAM
ncbi:MAG: hypothetical protein ACOH10_11290 [Rhodoglobus sp.]